MMLLRSAAGSTARRPPRRPLSAVAGVSSSLSSSSSPWQYQSGQQQQQQQQQKQQQPYSTTPPRHEDAATSEDTDGANGDAADATVPAFVKANAKEAARQYNDRRAAYNRAVSSLRKQYADEIAAQRKADEEEAARKRAALTRQRLERQRLKNIRSAKNAAREEEKRLARAAEFEEELRVAQINRDARKQRFAKARQLVLDELEAEAPLWLTTPEEVESALGVEGTQRLWTRPGGTVGAPQPTDDAEYWRFEAHTWDMSRTYVTPREELLRELEEMSYVQANVDPSYWTEERISEQKEVEEKAKLRAMVREEGRKALLMRQRQMMQDRYGSEQQRRKKREEEDGSGGSGSHEKPTIPRPMPAPKLDFLADGDAMEREGVKILNEDPTKFFRFEDDSVVRKETAGGADGEDGTTDRATLGRPIGLRDPVREDSSGMLDGTSPYPSLVGRLPRPDMRTEKERKRDEREQRMLAAAQEGAAAGGKGGDKKNSIEFAAEETLEDGSDPIDYDAIGNRGAEDDQEWEDDLDPEADADVLATPREQRFTEDDVDWVINELTDKTEKLKEVVRFEKQTLKTEKRAKQQQGDDEDDQDANDGPVADATTKSEGVDERGRRFVEYNLEEEDDGVEDVEFDANTESLLAEVEAIQESLSSEQLEAFENMDVSELEKMTDEVMSSDDIAEALSKVPGLTDEQIQAMIELEKSLESNEAIAKTFASDEPDFSDVNALLAADGELRAAFESGDKEQLEKELDRLLGEEDI